MVTINIPTDGSVTRFTIGRRGENEATQIIFDATHFIETFGNGSAVLLAKRSQDEASYPVAVVRDETTVTWLVNNADTAYQGNGKAELFWYIDEQLAKSVVYGTYVEPDIGENSETPPEPYESWVEEVIQAKNDAEAAATEAQEILASTIYIDNNGHFQIHG